MRIKANKTRMFNLVSTYFEIKQKMIEAVFYKTPRAARYLLEWQDHRGNKSWASLYDCGGIPLLRIDGIAARSSDGVTYRKLSYAELSERGMVEHDKAKAAIRRIRRDHGGRG